MTLSVLLPVFNAGAYLGECLDSILNQTFSDFQIIAINDGSSDNSSAILNEYSAKDDRIRVFSNAQNLGLIDTLNAGLAHCQGKYIARMDADDLIDASRFEKQLGFLYKNPSMDAVSSWMINFNELGEKNTVKYRTDLDDIKSTLIFYSPVSHAASMFRAETLKSLGYRKAYPYAEDYDLWTRFLTQGCQLGVIPEYLYHYRTHPSQSSSPENNVKLRLSLRQIAFNLLKTFKLESSDEMAEFHVKYLMLNTPIVRISEFLAWDAYLRQFSEAFNQSGFIRSDQFNRFVYINYWQNYYSQLSGKLKFREYLKLLNSPFNKFSPKHKLKLLLYKGFGL